MPDHQYLRFHVWIRKNNKLPLRTTVSLSPIISDLLALKLSQNPGPGSETASVITKWLDKTLSTWPAYDLELPISRQANYLAVQVIADPKLLKKVR